MTAGDALGEGAGQVREEKRKAYRREMGCHILVLYDWPTEREDDLHFSLPPLSLVQKALLSSLPLRTPPLLLPLPRLLRYGQERNLSFLALLESCR